MEIGTVCVKIAGRDAGLKAAVIEKLDSNFVLIDGQVRRRKCNLKHLEPLNKKIDIKNKASHADVVKAFKKLNIEIRETKPKTKKSSRPIRLRNSSAKEKNQEIKQESKKEDKKTVKKTIKKKIKK